MPTEIFLDSIDFDVESLIPVPFDPDGPRSESYPYVRLKRSGQQAILNFHVVILENPYLRVTVVPGLGGRILRIFDKRTNLETLGSGPRLNLIDAGPRGVWMPEGLQILVGNRHRMNAMGPVDFQIQEEGQGGLLLHELIGGIGVSWHATISLPPDRAEIRVAVRVLNRTLMEQECFIGLSVQTGPTRPCVIEDLIAQRLNWSSSCAWYDDARDCGGALNFDRGTFERVSLDHEEWVLHRRAEPAPILQARQSDSLELRYLPFSGLGSLEGWSEVGGVSLNADRLKFQATYSQSGQKFFLRTEDAQTLKSEVDLAPEKLTEIDLQDLPSPPVSFLVRDAHDDVTLLCPLEGLKRQMLDAEILVPAAIGMPAVAGPRERAGREAALLFLAGDDPTDQAVVAMKDPRWAASSRIMLGQYAIRKRKLDKALQWLDDGLGYHAEDHLAWWVKGMVTRIQGVESDDLLNAHYLAPLEPLLRAESFLAMPQTHGKEPSAVVKPLAADPAALIEIACALLDLRLFDEATRWIDEALRHGENQMLLYLQAWAFLTGSKMDVEAAELVQRAGKMETKSPYPWRPVELHVFTILSQRFPADEKLAYLLKLLDWALPLGSRPSQGADA